MMMMMFRGRDEGTKFIMRIKEQETRLTHKEYDHYYYATVIWRDQLHLEDQGTGNTPKPSVTLR